MPAGRHSSLFPSGIPITIGILFLLFIPILACTRTASTSAELTQIAQKVETYRPTSEPAFANTKETEAPERPAAELPTAVPEFTATPRKAISLSGSEPVSEVTGSEDPQEAEKTVLPTAVFSPLNVSAQQKTFYTVQNGDTAEAIARRFGAELSDLLCLNGSFNTKGYLKPGLTLLAPVSGRSFSNAMRILPDEYVVMGYPAIGYDLREEVTLAGGYLSDYTEYTSEGWLDGTDILLKVSQDYSISPILLMELIEFKSRWVSGQPRTIAEEKYPAGWLGDNSQGLNKQLTWAAQQLSFGYYGWREGTLSEIPFYKNPQPEKPIYFSPELNAGSVAIQYLFAQLYTFEEFEEAIYGENGFLRQFYLDFGNVWENYVNAPNGFNDTLIQPELTLPFNERDTWNLTGGPHEAWTTGSPLGALDFAPQMIEGGCTESNSWVTACAPGLVVRTGPGLVVEDLDMDGNEETGWVLIYLHVATRDRVAVGKTLALHSRIGHPSCEGGSATGTHVHVARKYNGEWVQAYGTIPFVMSGWTPFSGNNSYKGGLERGKDIVYATGSAQQTALVGY